MDQNRWIEALAIERRRGPDATYWLEDRINELLHDGQAAEADKLLAIANLVTTLQARTTLQ